MRWLAGVAAIIAAAVDILYVGIVINQSRQGPHDPLGSTVIFAATFIAVLAVTAAVAALGSATALRPALLGLSAVGLLAMGVIAIFSIGLPLILAGFLAFAALLVSLKASPQPAGILKAGAGALLALAIFVGGFEATVRAIACPATGAETGSGSGLVSGPYHYTCVNGKLTVYPGACNFGGASYDANGNVTSVSTC
jgi:hypothetical protein